MAKLRYLVFPNIDGSLANIREEWRTVLFWVRAPPLSLSSRKFDPSLRRASYEVSGGCSATGRCFGRVSQRQTVASELVHLGGARVNSHEDGRIRWAVFKDRLKSVRYTFGIAVRNELERLSDHRRNAHLIYCGGFDFCDWQYAITDRDLAFHPSIACRDAKPLNREGDGLLQWEIGDGGPNYRLAIDARIV